MAAIHEQVDIERWETEFSLVRLRQEARDSVMQWRTENPDRYPDEASVQSHIELMGPGGEIIIGPHDIAVVEQIREEVFAGLDPSTLTRLPTDAFVFGKGEPARPDVTKVGGVPYRSADKPWPTTRAGDPMTFVGQFCFGDSKDIAGNLPGDVLLIFADPGLQLGYQRPDICYFEWSGLGLTELIGSTTIPETEWTIQPCYGQIHRTYDYLGAEGHFEKYDQSYLLDVIEGTKIGGEPRWIQYPEELPGRFLCALGSVSSRSERRYPYVNVPDPLGYEEDGLMWDDMGSMYLLIDEAGKIHWAIQSY